MIQNINIKMKTDKQTMRVCIYKIIVSSMITILDLFKQTIEVIDHFLLCCLKLSSLPSLACHLQVKVAFHFSRLSSQVAAGGHFFSSLPTQYKIQILNFAHFTTKFIDKFFTLFIEILIQLARRRQQLVLPLQVIIIGLYVGVNHMYKDYFGFYKN